MYVGSTMRPLLHRLRKHHVLEYADRVTWFRVRGYSNTFWVESYFINRFRPRLNIRMRAAHTPADSGKEVHVELREDL